jgi:DNA polymerase-3 subunit alpha
MRKTIVYGLGAIKGVGEQAMQSVIDSRIKMAHIKIYLISAIVLI